MADPRVSAVADFGQAIGSMEGFVEALGRLVDSVEKANKVFEAMASQSEGSFSRVEKSAKSAGKAVETAGKDMSAGVVDGTESLQELEEKLQAAIDKAQPWNRAIAAGSQALRDFANASRGVTSSGLDTFFKDSEFSLSRFITGVTVGNVVTLGARKIFQEISQFMRESIGVYEAARLATEGYANMTQYAGVSAAEAQAAIESLTENGVIAQDAAMRSVESLLKGGLGIEEATAMTERFTESMVASGVAPAELGNRLQQLSQAFVANNTRVLDSIGVHQNWNELVELGRKVLEDQGQSVDGLSDNFLAFQGVMRLTEQDMGAVERQLDSNTIASAKMENSQNQLKAVIGGVLAPALVVAQNELTNLYKSFMTALLGADNLTEGSSERLKLLQRIMVTVTTVLVGAVKVIASTFKMLGSLVWNEIERFILRPLTTGIMMFQQLASGDWKGAWDTLRRAPQVWADQSSASITGAFDEWLTGLSGIGDSMNQTLDQSFLEIENRVVDFADGLEDKRAPDVGGKAAEAAQKAAERLAQQLSDLDAQTDMQIAARLRKSLEAETKLMADRLKIQQDGHDKLLGIENDFLGSLRKMYRNMGLELDIKFEVGSAGDRAKAVEIAGNRLSEALIKIEQTTISGLMDLNNQYTQWREGEFDTQTQSYEDSVERIQSLASEALNRLKVQGNEFVGIFADVKDTIAKLSDLQRDLVKRLYDLDAKRIADIQKEESDYTKWRKRKLEEEVDNYAESLEKQRRKAEELQRKLIQQQEQIRNEFDKTRLAAERVFNDRISSLQGMINKEQSLGVHANQQIIKNLQKMIGTETDEYEEFLAFLAAQEHKETQIATSGTQAQLNDTLDMIARMEQEHEYLMEVFAGHREANLDDAIVANSLELDDFVRMLRNKEEDHKEAIDNIIKKNTEEKNKAIRDSNEKTIRVILNQQEELLQQQEKTRLQVEDAQMKYAEQTRLAKLETEKRLADVDAKLKAERDFMGLHKNEMKRLQELITMDDINEIKRRADMRRTSMQNAHSIQMGDADRQQKELNNLLMAHARNTSDGINLQWGKSLGNLVKDVDWYTKEIAKKFNVNLSQLKTMHANIQVQLQASVDPSSIAKLMQQGFNQAESLAIIAGTASQVRLASTEMKDFISRPGQPVQRFSVDDTVIGVKDPEAFLNRGVTENNGTPVQQDFVVNQYFTLNQVSSDMDIDQIMERAMFRMRTDSLVRTSALG